MRNIFSLVTVLLLAIYSDAYSSVGTQEINFNSKSSGRMLAAEIYYPSSCALENKEVPHGVWMRDNYSKSECQIDEKKLYPLVVFSHGWTGDRFGNSWIAEGLVRQGYIVAMIDHTLNTSYAHDDLFLYTSMWQRPIDMSEMLTYVLDHTQFGKLIDKNRIAAAGFSLGGATSLWLGGVTANSQQFKNYLDKRYASWSTWPQHDVSKAKAVDWTKATLSYRDERIKAVISIAPDLGAGFDKDGLSKAAVPMLIIVGDKDTITPKKQNAEFYAKHIKNSELFVIKGADHFVFLNKCSSLGVEEVAYLCSSDKAKDKTHKITMDRIHAFLDKAYN